jgi:hypothetical protein
LPRTEIEAWLLYDPRAIAKAFRETTFVRLPGNPESIADPKKHLGDLVWRRYRKTYLHTIHNEKIAGRIDLTQLRRSRSFSPHFGFVSTVARSVR